jgi:hypothetical protein
VSCPFQTTVCVCVCVLGDEVATISTLEKRTLVEGCEQSFQGLDFLRCDEEFERSQERFD